MKTLILTHVSIYPKGRDYDPERQGDKSEVGFNHACKENPEIKNRADILAANLGITECGEPKFGSISGHIPNGRFYHLGHGHCIVMDITDDNNFALFSASASPTVLLRGRIESNRYVTDGQIDYSFHLREPNYLEKVGLIVTKDFRVPILVS